MNKQQLWKIMELMGEYKFDNDMSVIKIVWE